MKKATKSPRTITVLVNGKYEVLRVCDILCCCSFRDYTWIWMKNGKRHKASGKLKKIAALIDSVDFFRLNALYLINIDKVKEIIYGEYDGDVYLGAKTKVTALIKSIRKLKKELIRRNKRRVLSGRISADEHNVANGFWTIVFCPGSEMFLGFIPAVYFSHAKTVLL